MKAWIKLRTIWVDFFLYLRHRDPIMVFDPLFGWVVEVLEGAVAVDGLYALGAGLYSIGMPKSSAVKYETALNSNKLLVIAHVIADKEVKAKSILETTDALEIAAHHGELAT